MKNRITSRRPVTGEQVLVWLEQERDRRNAACIEQLEQDLADAHAERDELRAMLNEARDPAAAAMTEFREKVGVIVDAGLVMSAMNPDNRLTARIYMESRISEAVGMLIAAMKGGGL